MAQDYDESCTGSLRRKFDTANLRRRNNVSGYADHKQIAKALIEDDLRRYPRIGTSENNGERLLPSHQLATAHMPRECIVARNVSGETTVSIPQTFERIQC
jgi:hypothetical protein